MTSIPGFTSNLRHPPEADMEQTTSDSPSYRIYHWIKNTAVTILPWLLLFNNLLRLIFGGVDEPFSSLLPLGNVTGIVSLMWMHWCRGSSSSSGGQTLPQ